MKVMQFACDTSFNDFYSHRKKFTEPEAKILLDAQEKEIVRREKDDKSHISDSDPDVEEDVSLEELRLNDNLEEEKV